MSETYSQLSDAKSNGDYSLVGHLESKINELDSEICRLESMY